MPSEQTTTSVEEDGAPTDHEDLKFTVVVAEDTEDIPKTRRGRRSKPEEYRTVQMNEPSNQQWSLFIRQIFEFYELIHLRAEEARRKCFESGDKEAMMAEVERTIQVVMAHPLITNAEKNQLLRLIIDKIVPYEARIEIIYH